MRKFWLLLVTLVALCVPGLASANNITVTPKVPTYGTPFYPQWNTQTLVQVDVQAEIQWYDIMFAGDNPAGLEDWSSLKDQYFSAPSSTSWVSHPCWEHGFHWIGSFWHYRVKWPAQAWGPWHDSPLGPGSYGQCQL